MIASSNRREFLQASASGLILQATAIAHDAEAQSISVVVWDERQPEQKQAYDNFLGNQIAAHLKSKPGFSVQSVSIDDDEKGLSPGIIRECDVLIWWGHRRQADIAEDGSANHRADQGRNALTHRSALGPLVHTI